MTTPPSPPGRLTSVDAYRGLVMFLMMASVLNLARLAKTFPDNPVWRFLAWHQEHVEWSGCTLHDLIQPSFSFLVGVAVPFSIASRLSRGLGFGPLALHAAWRALLLVGLGIFLRSVGRPQPNFTFEDTLTQIGIGDRFGALFNPRGIDIPALQQHVLAGKPVPEFQGEKISNSQLLALPCTILVPAALERVIHRDNAAQIKCRILAEGANGPTTPEADAILSASDIFIIPDVLCNAGGVTVSYFEWVQDIQQLMWSETQVNEKLSELMLRAFHQVLTLAKSRHLTMRTAALSLGVEKVAREKQRRGLFP